MGGVVIYLFSALNGFMFLEALSFVIIFWAIFKLRFTPESFKKMFFPLVYLLFLVPPPGVAIDAVSLPLKKISTMGAFLLLKSFHFPVDIYGVILSVGGKELLIGDACSGFRSISTLLALGAIYAYYQNISFQKKWIVFISVIPIAIVGNIARIAVTGVIVYYLGLKYAEGFFHSISGLILFVFTTLGLVVFTLLISRRNNEER
jgi:exosortase